MIVDEREQRPESIYVDAPAEGVYRLEIGTVKKRLDLISFSLTIRTVRPKREHDGLRFEAQRINTEFKQLGSKRSPQYLEARGGRVENGVETTGDLGAGSAVPCLRFFERPADDYPVWPNAAYASGTLYG